MWQLGADEVRSSVREPACEARALIATPDAFPVTPGGGGGKQSVGSGVEGFDAGKRADTL